MARLKKSDKEKLEYIGKLMREVNNTDELLLLSDIFFDCLKNCLYIEENEFELVMRFHNQSIQNGCIHIFDEVRDTISKK